MATGDFGSFGPSTVMGTFVLFCRIGSCLMVAPGVSTSQIPVQVRLYVAIAITLALTPLLLAKAEPFALADNPITMLRLIVMEALIGAMIGMLGRMFFSALESLTVASATLLGLTNPFGVNVDSTQPMPPLASIAMLAATAVIFAADFHWEILRGLAASYNAIPIQTDFDTRYSVQQIATVLSQSFLVAIRVTSPFFIYSLIVNFALTLINRVTPQISVFYVAPPFIVAGGMVLLYFVIRGEVGQFMDAFASWLSWG